MLSEALKESKEQSLARIREQNSRFDISKLVTQIDDDLKNSIEESAKNTKELQERFIKQE